MSRYIDADKLKEHASHYVRTQPHFHYGDWDNMCISGKEVDEIIDTCPTADLVEVIHGYNKDFDYPSLFECSICGWSDYDTYTGDTSEYNFCPNCGAKMDGERRENGD